MSDDALQARRAEDQKGIRAITCWIAQRLSETWEWIDKRDIDKHAMAWLTAVCGWDLTKWAMAFVSDHADTNGVELAAQIGSVTAVYGLFAGAVVKWYFERQSS